MIKILYSLCNKCGDKIPYRQKYCNKCKAKAEVEREQIQKVKSKKYNSDRYIRDKESDSYRLFYLSKEWKDKRNQILKKYNYECAMCKSLCQFTPATDVHHILNLKDNFEKRLDDDNLIPLCYHCHHDIVHKLKLNNKDKINKYINQRINSDKFIKKLLNINIQD